MAITFRNVEGSTDDPIESWPYEGLVEVLERGGVRAWGPIFKEIRREPWGPVARRIESYVRYCEEPALVNLFGLAITRARETQETGSEGSSSTGSRSSLSDPRSAPGTPRTRS